MLFEATYNLHVSGRLSPASMSFDHARVTASAKWAWPAGHPSATCPASQPVGTRTPVSIPFFSRVASFLVGIFHLACADGSVGALRTVGGSTWLLGGSEFAVIVLACNQQAAW